MNEQYSKEEESMIASLKKEADLVVPDEAGLERVLRAVSDGPHTEASTPIEPVVRGQRHLLEWNAFWNSTSMISGRVRKSNSAVRYGSIAAVTFLVMILLVSPFENKSTIETELTMMDELAQSEATDTLATIADLNTTSLGFANQEDSESDDVASLLNL